jgi:lactoylglutathione lyase
MPSAIRLSSHDFRSRSERRKFTHDHTATYLLRGPPSAYFKSHLERVSPTEMPQPPSSTPSTYSLPPPGEVGAFLPHGVEVDQPLEESDLTIGAKLNHFMLRIRDPAASMRFYIQLMGMRTVFTMNVGPFTIYYLGYPKSPAHRADPALFGKDTSANLPHTLGLLELYHIHGSELQAEGKGEGYYYSSGNIPPHLGFGHLGFTVPDVPAFLTRLRTAGVPVVKELLVSDRASIPLSEWEAGNGVGIGCIHENYRAIFSQIAFVRDPVSDQGVLLLEEHRN